MKTCVRISLLFILLAVASSSAKPRNGKFRVSHGKKTNFQTPTGKDSGDLGEICG